MEDERIVKLYLERNESAISESEAKYGIYCHTIAYNILNSHEDSDECVNDTWQGAWNAIPPEKPRSLRAFLGRITRNIAIDRYRSGNAQKRACETDAVIDEFWECIPSESASVEDGIMLKQAIDSFLSRLDTRTRVIFMRRYWYSMSVKDIASGMGISESHVSVILHRTRRKFKVHLTKEGVFV